MFIHPKWLAFLSILMLGNSCANGISKERISEEYFGYWAETEFNYSFKKDGSFIFSTRGHFGNTSTSGSYVRIDSFLLLNPKTDWLLKHKVLNTRLIISESGNCIKDFRNNLYCLDYAALDKYSNKKDQIIEKMENRLFELPRVKKVIKDYKNYSKFNPEHPHFNYEGFILIDHELYHAFNMKKKDSTLVGLSIPYRNIQYQHYLISISKNSIYQHHTYKDSLSMISILF